MKLAIAGAGAIGGYLGAKLALAGEEVTLIARGPHLRAMQERGLRLLEAGAEALVNPRCVEHGAEAGPQEYVILAMKAHSVAPALDSIRPLLGLETAVVTAQNGVPWWYFHALPGPWEGRRIEAVDPGGRIWDAIGPGRVIGCVVYPACEVVSPGVVQHLEGDRFSLGEPDGSRSDRVTRLAQSFIKAGLRAPVRTRIRNEIWVKLWGNVALNPLSALTRATLEELCREPGARAFALAVMRDVEVVALALGEKMPVDAEARLTGAGEVGAHKTSMLQDLELGRPMEVDAIIHAVVEIARHTGTETPHLDALDGMIRLLDRSAAPAAPPGA